MPTTPALLLPYPAPTDPADVPLDMQELAERLEAIKAGGGAELAFAQNASGATVTATTQPTAQTLVTAPAVTLDGATAVVVTFDCESVAAPSTGATLSIWLFDGATGLGRLAALGQAAGFQTALHLTFRLTPTAGSHTYSIRASVTGGTAYTSAGAGGPGAPAPTMIRILRA